MHQNTDYTHPRPAQRIAITPFAAMASLTTTAPLFLGHWPIAILVSFTVLFTNPLFMLGGGGTRQIGTGITVAHVASAATVGLVLLVDHLRTDVSTAALAA